MRFSAPRKETDAFKRGVNSFHSKRKRQQNTNDVSSPDHADWDRGWCSADQNTYLTPKVYKRFLSKESQEETK